MKNNYEKLIQLLALSFIMCGCNPSKIEPLKTSKNICNVNGWNCHIIEIDNCEYIQGGYLLSHKGKLQVLC